MSHMNGNAVHLQSPEPRLQTSLVYGVRDAKHLIEVARLPQLPVRLVDGVEQIRQDDQDLYPFAVIHELPCPRLRLRFTCPDPDGIVCGLNIPCHELLRVSCGSDEYIVYVKRNGTARHSFRITQ